MGESNKRTNMFRDPLDLVWTAAAAALGITLERDDEVYASWDGATTLKVCPESAYDPDDSLAQLVLHEICHALVQGPAARSVIDWGLFDLGDEAVAVAEHACHRLQAALLDLYGLRGLLAVTTDWRPYWDALPADPLADGDDPAIAVARAAWPEAVRGPWSGPLARALTATADLADATRPFAEPDSLWAATVPRTPAGVARGPQGATCGGCTWRDGDRCRALDDRPVDPSWPACLRFESPLTVDDCRACGACCREGFHMVGVDDDEPFVAAHPDWVRRDAHGAHVPRDGGGCIALAANEPPYTCRAYGIRPAACADFEIAGDHCLTARRRVGLSRS